MSNNSSLSIAPESTAITQAQKMGARTNNSPIISTSVKREPQSPPPHRIQSTASTLRLTPPEPVADGSIDVHSSPHAPGLAQSVSPEATSSPSRSRCLKLRLSPRRAETLSPQREVSEPAANGEVTAGLPPAGRTGSRLKLKLRGIQAAIEESPHTTDHSCSFSDTSSVRKRTPSEATFDDDFDTDSEIDLTPPNKKVGKIKADEITIDKTAIEEPVAHTTSRKAKKVKTIHEDSDYEDDAMFDAGDEESSSNASPDSKLVLSSNVLKRSERILDPTNPDHAQLIAVATKAGSEYYDSDADELPGSVKETNKPHLFRNVSWGTLATDYSNPSDFTTEPEFTQFVPGRFERLPDGSASDQKQKLIVKLTDKHHRQRIFLNPPPRDWNNQEAITALNKRTVQQIRRNTSVRFREVVEPYVKEEREWILAHLTDGKPTGGWRRFVGAFNCEFEGKMLSGCKMTRPERSHSSLTKEVERFGSMYAKGVVPKTVLQSKGASKGKE